MSDKSYCGNVDARWGVLTTRGVLHRREISLLLSCGWKENKATYDGTITWSHPEVLDGTWMRRETAVSVAMGDLEID